LILPVCFHNIQRDCGSINDQKWGAKGSVLLRLAEKNPVYCQEED